MAASIVTVYKNGDSHFFGKKLVVNSKHLYNFENFLDKVTRDIHARVAVRRICTPNHGTKVVKLDQLKNGGVYVALGPERFKRIKYSQLRLNHPTLQPKKPGEQSIKPVLHSRLHASARHQKVALAEPLKNRIVYVYRNGDTATPGIKLLLDKRILQNMDIVLQYITDKVKLRTGAVKSIYTMDGVEIHETKEIKTGEQYVAVGYGKFFIKSMYNQQNSSFGASSSRRTTNNKTSNQPELQNKYKNKIRAESKASKQPEAEIEVKKEMKKSKDERSWKAHLKNNKHEKEQVKQKIYENPPVVAEEENNSSFFSKLADEISETKDDIVSGGNSFLDRIVNSDDENDDITKPSKQPTNNKKQIEAPIDRTQSSPLNSNTLRKSRENTTIIDDTKSDRRPTVRRDSKDGSKQSNRKKSNARSFVDSNNTRQDSLKSEDLSRLRKSSVEEGTEEMIPIEAVKEAALSETPEPPQESDRKPSLRRDSKGDSKQSNRKKSNAFGSSFDNSKKTRQDSLKSEDLSRSRKSSVEEGTEEVIPIEAVKEETLSGTPEPPQESERGQTNNLDDKEIDEKDDPVLFKASGNQSEKANFVKENQHTRVEETIDNQVAEEVEDEEIVDDESIDEDIEENNNKDADNRKGEEQNTNSNTQ